jgi:hypothetical protein
MANIPVNINTRSEKPREVTIVVHVDGQVYTTETYQIPEYAIPYAAAAACTQLEDPDLDAAIQDAKENGTPLPKGY